MADTAQEVRKAIKDLPRDGFLSLWYNDEQDKLLLNVGDWIEEEDLDAWYLALRPLASELDYDYEIGKPSDSDGEGLWVKIAFRTIPARMFLEKRAISPTLNTLARGLGYLKGPIPGSPNPVIATLASGALGAGLGYGTGALLEKILPRKWKRDRLRKTLALMGGTLGAVPGAMWMYANTQTGRPWYSGELMQKTSQFDSATGFNRPWGTLAEPRLPDGFYADAFHAAIWDDPRNAGRLPLNVRAAASGVVEGAAATRGTRFITPADMGRFAMGMGSGYLSGAVAGKVLGALMGMPEDTQNTLRNTGMWAGLVANLVPMVFGR